MRRATIGLLALACAIAAVAGCGTRSCKSGTVLLTLDLSAGAEQASVIDVSLSVDGAPAQIQSVSRTAGKSSDTIEIDFASGYPTGHTLEFAITARSGGDVLAMTSQDVTAAKTCSVVPMALIGASGADGGTDAPVALDLAGADFVIAPAACGTTGDACTSDSQCCSRLCDAATQRCIAAQWNCAPTAAPCKTPTDCCSLHCNTSSVCDAVACVADGQTCTVDRDCCSGTCLGGTCQAISTACKTAGNPCSGPADCCSGLCSNTVCSPRSSFCMQTGDLCYRDGDCCSGACAVAPGSAAGTCSAPATTTCGISGLLCTSCNGCCSGVCAPFGPSGATICTPPTGCRTAGDSCASAADCCGAPGSTLPGDGNGHCMTASGASLGSCAISGCDPEGGTCKLTTATCSVSGRNDCCTPVGGTAMCQADTLGTPRCFAVSACQSAGQPCASNSDCCGTACAPDASGTLRCAGSACATSGVGCSSTSQCCRGLSCVAPAGSVRGTCRSFGVTCALYGQACSTASDCCNTVPCTNQRCTM